MGSVSVRKSDVLIIGSGVASLALSLYLDRKLSVNIVTKASASDTSSLRAQGGIACVTDRSDSFREHIHDTMIAGAGLCDRNIVEMVVEAAPEKINDLKRWGVKFSGGNRRPELGREGGHSKRRILHHDDSTGREVIEKLLKKVSGMENVNFFEEHTAVNLIMNDRICAGAYVLRNRDLKIEVFLSRVTVMATGGCGKVYLYTSNPDVATGDGIAMAYRAGARIANMEFIQFHPTILYSQLEKNFLITEAMRGEGAVLLNSAMKDFMKKYDRRGNLAPRDIVARAIDSEMKKEGSKHIYLNIYSRRTPEFIRSRFPGIYGKLKKLGMDITKENIPVVPAAHYCCGGIHVDSRGFSSIDGLMAVGEVSHTGLHGANRLASNSLLEALVLGSRAAEVIPGYVRARGLLPGRPWEYTGDRLPREKIFIEHNWLTLRMVMWHYVGIVRTSRRLREAMKRIALIEKEVDYHYWNYLITPGMVELRNLVETAKIIIACAMKRKESRGLHYNVDYPSRKKSCRKNTYIIRNERMD